MMGGNMLTIEFDEPIHSDQCERCGGRATRLTRFVSWNDEAYAVYYAEFTDNHPDGVVAAFLILGNWDEDAVPMDRVAFGLNLVAKEDGFGVIVVDAADTPWADSRQAGTKLTRENALKHPRIKEVFHITDHIFEEDKPIIEFLERQNPDGE